MKFIGQHHIMNQLKFLLPDLYLNKDRGFNFLIRGPSGYGKTTLALAMANYLTGGTFEIYLADWTEYKFRKRVIFIDEVHKISEFERLYHIMDSGKFVFIFATNSDGNLPEAFSNRCTEFIFDDYSDDELTLIARTSATFQASDDSFMQLVEAGNRNPRIVKSLVDRFGTYFRQNPQMDSRSADFHSMLVEIFKIEGGLDTLARRYLEVLEEIGGSASLSLLKSLLHVDEGTLKYNVEPVLMKKQLIKITQKGRQLIDRND